MTPDSPHWEESLNLPTQGIPLEELTDEICRAAVKQEVEYTFSHFDPFTYIDKALVDDIVSDSRPRPSIAPVVWLSGTLMANEAFKFICGYPTADHDGYFFDQYQNRICAGKSKNNL